MPTKGMPPFKTPEWARDRDPIEDLKKAYGAEWDKLGPEEQLALMALAKKEAGSRQLGTTQGKEDLPWSLKVAGLPKKQPETVGLKPVPVGDKSALPWALPSVSLPKGPVAEAEPTPPVQLPPDIQSKIPQEGTPAAGKPWELTVRPEERVPAPEIPPWQQGAPNEPAELAPPQAKSYEEVDPFSNIDITKPIEPIPGWSGMTQADKGLWLTKEASRLSAEGAAWWHGAIVGGAWGSRVAAVVPHPVAKALLPIIGAAAGAGLETAGIRLAEAGVEGELGRRDIPETVAAFYKDAVETAALQGGFGTIAAGWPTIKGAVKGPLGWVNQNVGAVIGYPLKKAVNARILPTTETIISHGQRERVEVMKSLREVWQPAVERLPDDLQDIFRGSQAIKSRLSKLGTEIGADLAKESDPLVRLEVIKGIRGTPTAGLVTQGAKDILEKYELGLKDMGLPIRQENEFRKIFAKSMNKHIEAPEEVFTGTDIVDKLIKPIQDSLVREGGSAKWRLKKVQEMLKEAISNPAVSNDFKALAKDIYNLPSVLPQEIAESSKKVTKQLLTERLKKMPGVVVPELPAGAKPEEYMRSNWKSFITKGNSLYVKKDVELELRALDMIPKIAHGWSNKWFMTPWKTSKIMMRPATHVRNFFSNAMLNHMGGLPFWRIDLYRRAFREMPTIVGGKGGSQAWKDYAKITGAGGTFSVEDIVNLSKGMKYDSNIFDRGLKIFDEVSMVPRSYYNAEEQMFKFAKYLHNIEKGMDKRNAAWDAMKWTFNYGEVTRATAYMRSYVAPFFTWQSKVIPLMAESIVKNPVQWTGAIMLYQGLQSASIRSAGISKQEWDYINKVMPDYIKKGMFFTLPWRDSDGRLQLLNLTYMMPGFGDISEAADSPFFGLLSHPVLSMYAAWTSNRGFSGAPLSFEWEPATTQYLKKMAAMWETLAPAPFPLGTDWNMVWKMAKERALPAMGVGQEPYLKKSLTPGQALSSLVGFKITPGDKKAWARSKEAVMRVHLSEMQLQLRRELGSATSSSERDSIKQHYKEILKDYKEGLTPETFSILFPEF